jgi:hypothetical protein
VLHVETRVGSDWFQRFKLTYDKLLSIFAFNANLRPCNLAMRTAQLPVAFKAVEASRTDPNFYVEPHTAVVHVLAGAYTRPLFSLP